MTCEVRNNQGRVCLSGEMNIYAAPLLKEQLLVALRANLGAAAIDLAEVTEMDTAGLQLLVLARRLSMACGSELKIFNPSEPAREVLELCGLERLIVPNVVPAALPEALLDSPLASVPATKKRATAKAKRRRKS